MPDGCLKIGDWFLPFDRDRFVTVEAVMTGVTADFRDFARKGSVRFCGAIRRVIKDRSMGKDPMEKAALCKKFGLSSRAANLAIVEGNAKYDSAVECLKLQKESLSDKIASLTETLKALNEELTEKSKGAEGLLPRQKTARFARISKTRTKIESAERAKTKTESKLARLPEKPRFFIFGKKVYREQPGQQHRIDGKVCLNPDYSYEHRLWRKEWEAERNPMFGARGSSDEAGGNSTYRIVYSGDRVKKTKFAGSEVSFTVVEFTVFYAGKVAGKFSLNGKEGRPLQDILTKNNAPFGFKVVGGVKRKIGEGRTALKVWFTRRDKRIHIHVSREFETISPPSKPDAVIGVDLNHGHFESFEVFRTKRSVRLGEYRKNVYDVDGASDDKKRVISEQIRAIVKRAKEINGAVVLERLDFEGAKRTLRNKLGATLHKMPYKAIRGKFLREGALQGVEIRFVSPGYTSLLGNVLATHNVRLSRDAAAAGVIALLGIEKGPEYLDKLFGSLKRKQRLRLNVKGRFGRHVYGSGQIGGRRSDSPPKCPDSDTVRRLKRAGARINKIAKETARWSQCRRAGRIICRSEEIATLWQGVTDTLEVKKRTDQDGTPYQFSLSGALRKSACSTLSKFG